MYTQVHVYVTRLDYIYMYMDAKAKVTVANVDV